MARKKLLATVSKTRRLGVGNMPTVPHEIIKAAENRKITIPESGYKLIIVSDGSHKFVPCDRSGGGVL